MKDSGCAWYFASPFIPLLLSRGVTVASSLSLPCLSSVLQYSCPFAVGLLDLTMDALIPSSSLWPLIFHGRFASDSLRLVLGSGRCAQHMRAIIFVVCPMSSSRASVAVTLVLLCVWDEGFAID